MHMVKESRAPAACAKEVLDAMVATPSADAAVKASSLLHKK